MTRESMIKKLCVMRVLAIHSGRNWGGREDGERGLCNLCALEHCYCYHGDNEGRSATLDVFHLGSQSSEQHEASVRWEEWHNIIPAIV